MQIFTKEGNNEVLIHAIMSTNLEDIRLSEISQTQKGKYCIVPLI